MRSAVPMAPRSVVVAQLNIKSHYLKASVHCVVFCALLANLDRTHCVLPLFFWCQGDPGDPYDSRPGLPGSPGESGRSGAPVSRSFFVLLRFARFLQFLSFIDLLIMTRRAHWCPITRAPILHRLTTVHDTYSVCCWLISPKTKSTGATMNTRLTFLSWRHIENHGCILAHKVHFAVTYAEAEIVLIVDC